MCLLECGGVNFLVIYGGASPEHGPLEDVIYAQLPSAESIGKAIKLCVILS